MDLFSSQLNRLLLLPANKSAVTQFDGVRGGPVTNADVFATFGETNDVIAMLDYEDDATPKHSPIDDLLLHHLQMLTLVLEG